MKLWHRRLGILQLVHGGVFYGVDAEGGGVAGIAAVLDSLDACYKWFRHRLETNK